MGALNLAIKSQHWNCVDFLLRNSAYVYYPEPLKVDNSPIFYAIRTSSLKAGEIILDSNK
jgi:hypothetical protein